MQIEFSFKEFFTENLGRILKPFGLATLMHGEKSRQSDMLIDSGADVTLIPKSIGDDLNLRLPEPSEIKSLGGIAGGVSVVYRTIELQIEDIKFPCRVAWAQVDTVPAVIGRLDVFDAFDIEFKQSERKIIFKPKQATAVTH